MTEVKELEYIAFMCATYHINYDYLEQTLKEYNIGLYLMASEVTQDAHKETNGEHFHFLVQMTDADYHKYAKRCFKDKLKLRGQARDGNPRQYGRVKKIEDIQRMGAYTIKQGNIRTNMTEQQLETYKKITFTTKDEMAYEDEMYEYLVNNAIHDSHSPYIGQKLTSYQGIALYVVKFIRSHKKKIYFNRNKLDKYVRYYQAYYLKQELTDEAFLNQLL